MHYLLYALFINFTTELFWAVNSRYHQFWSRDLWSRTAGLGLGRDFVHITGGHSAYHQKCCREPNPRHPDQSQSLTTEPQLLRQERHPACKNITLTIFECFLRKL